MANLTKLRAEDNRLTTLPAGIFASTPKLQQLTVNDNELASLPTGIFQGLTNLRELYLQRNRLTSVPAGIFQGLSRLEYLALSNNALTTLPDGVFNGLTELSGALPESQPSGVVARGGLQRSLEARDALDLQQQADGGLADSVRESREARGSCADIQQDRGLADRRFNGLSQLKELHLANNEFRSLPPGVFTGLDNLEELTLWGCSLESLPADLFSHLGRLKHVQLSWNQLWSLPEGIFEGLRSLDSLWLYSNPGAPFTFPIKLVRTDDGALSHLATIVVDAPLGAPFPLTVDLSATGGTLSATEATVAAGSSRSDPITVTRTGPGGVSVRLAPEPALPGAQGELRPRVGLPLDVFTLAPNSQPAVVGTLAAQTLRMDEGTVSVDVVSAFRDPDGDALTYGASSANEGVATARLTGSTLTLTPVGSGSTTVTVKATDTGGSGGAASQSLAVDVWRRRGATMTPESLTVDEGTSSSYAVVLDVLPTGPVTVRPSVPTGTDVSVTPSQLAFGTGTGARRKRSPCRPRPTPTRSPTPK